MFKRLLLCSSLLLTNCTNETITTETQLRKYNKEYCYDGDTCYINYRNAQYTLRLKDIDTPEINGKCEQETQLANKAKQFINDKIKRALTIRIETYGQDKYGRIIGKIYLDGYDIEQWLIDEKLGKRYRKGIKIDWCK